MAAANLARPIDIAMHAKGVGQRKVAFSRVGDWERLVAETIDHAAFDFDCVDFRLFDMAGYDAVVPLSISDIAILRERFGSSGPKHRIAGAGLTAACDDKARFNILAAELGFGPIIPQPRAAGSGPYPYMLKRRHGVAGDGVYIIRHAHDEVAHEAAIASPDFFCQAYVPGRDEYATHMLIAGGVLRYHFTNRYQMPGEYSVKSAALPPQQEAIGIEAPAGAVALLTRLVLALGFDGTCCANYKMIEGQVRLLELNPRCGYSLFRDINRYLNAYFAVLES